MFSRFSGTLVTCLIKIDDFGFEFHKISLSYAVEASWALLMLCLYGNGSIKRPALYGSDRHTSQK